MKTNLKTCPDSPWKTAFEKELREQLQTDVDIERIAKSELWREGARWVIKQIEEILGE